MERLPNFFYLTHFIIHQEFEYQLAGEIFGKKIQKIDPTDADRKILADSSNIPDNLIDLLKFEDDVLTKHTQERLENTWIEAQNEAKVQKQYSVSNTS